jgi:hypothetical protein
MDSAVARPCDLTCARALDFPSTHPSCILCCCLCAVCHVVSCQMRAETLTLLHALSTEPDSLRAMGMKEGLEGLQMVRSPMPHHPTQTTTPRIALHHTARCTHHALHTPRIANTARCTHRVHPRHVLLTLATLEQHRLKAAPHAPHKTEGSAASRRHSTAAHTWRHIRHHMKTWYHRTSPPLRLRPTLPGHDVCCRVDEQRHRSQASPAAGPGSAARTVGHVRHGGRSTPTRTHARCPCTRCNQA